MISPPTLADLMADPGELIVSCLDCHHNTTMPVAALLPRYPTKTPFPEEPTMTVASTGRWSRPALRFVKSRRLAGQTRNRAGEMAYRTRSPDHVARYKKRLLSLKHPLISRDRKSIGEHPGLL
jgi:hypothetical protein